jgi:hypothetical protein
VRWRVDWKCHGTGELQNLMSGIDLQQDLDEEGYQETRQNMGKRGRP